MNLPVELAIEDVQNALDKRRIAINKVGIKDIRHPVQVRERAGGVQHSIATFSMYVNLAHHLKGTHMSRFIEELGGGAFQIDTAHFQQVLQRMAQRLEATTGYIEVAFPFFMQKQAPVSGVQSLMDYEVTVLGEIRDGDCQITLCVLVPVTSLCPCSKKISSYGAHNQRSHVTVTLAPALRAYSIVGMLATILASLVTTPSFTGTLRSARINTRLPRKSRSVILMNFMNVSLERSPPLEYKLVRYVCMYV